MDRLLTCEEWVAVSRFLRCVSSERALASTCRAARDGISKASQRQRAKNERVGLVKEDRRVAPTVHRQARKAFVFLHKNLFSPDVVEGYVGHTAETIQTRLSELPCDNLRAVAKQPADCVFVMKRSNYWTPTAVAAGLFAFGCAAAEPGREVMVVLPLVIQARIAMEAAIAKDIDSFITRNDDFSIELDNKSAIYFATHLGMGRSAATLSAVVIGDFDGNTVQVTTQGNALDPFCFDMRLIFTRVCELSIPCITMCNSHRHDGHRITPRFTWPPF